MKKALRTIIHFSFVLFLCLAFGASQAEAQPEGRARFLGAPEYTLTPAAEAAGIDGKLKLLVKITKEGTVKDVNVLAGPSWPCGTNPKTEIKDVREAVKANTLVAKFDPATKDGKAVSDELVLTFAVGEAYRKLQEKREREAAIASGKVLPSTIKGGVLNGRALSLVRPEYPSLARSRRLTGSASVEILIDELGKVVQAGVVSGFIDFHENSRDAACSSIFSPTILDGKPVKVSGVITYNFAR